MPKKLLSSNPQFFIADEKKKFIFKPIFWIIWVLKHILNIHFFDFFFGMSKKLLSSNLQFFIVDEKKMYIFLIYLLSSMGSKTHFKHIIFSYIFFGSMIIEKFQYLGSIIFFSLKLPMFFFLESVSIY